MLEAMVHTDAAKARPSAEISRITVDPDQMGGVPCLRGLRIPVASVVATVADGLTTEEILEALPDLEPVDIRDALLYAAESVGERQLPIRRPA